MLWEWQILSVALLQKQRVYEVSMSMFESIFYFSMNSLLIVQFVFEKFLYNQIYISVTSALHVLLLLWENVCMKTMNPWQMEIDWMERLTERTISNGVCVFCTTSYLIVSSGFLGDVVGSVFFCERCCFDYRNVVSRCRADSRCHVELFLWELIE